MSTETLAARLRSAPRMGGWLRWGLGLVVSGVFLWLVFRGANLGTIGATIAHAQPADLIPVAAALSASFLFRAWRWLLCFEERDRISFPQAFGAYIFGALSTLIIPARLGDLVRVYVLRQSAAVSASKALGTLVIERLADLFSVVILIAVLLPKFDLPEWIKLADLAAAGLACVALVVVYLLARESERLRAPEWVKSRRPLNAVFRFVVSLLAGFAAVRSGGRGLLILLLSAGVWSTNIAYYAFALSAVRINLGWSEAGLLTGVLALTAILPAGPGYVGSFEAAAVATLGLFAVGRSVAIGYLEYTRIASLLTMLVLGAVALVCLRLTRRSQGRAGLGSIQAEGAPYS